ncbi:MAG TPA: hypothetical protein VM509_13445 [Planctomycetota bacterium]|nr:hypothetical protein [Planctomycetota bacterium]
MLAGPEDVALVDDAFANIALDFRYKDPSEPVAKSLTSADVVLVDSSPSLPSEVRWFPPGDREPTASARDRALWCARAALLGRRVPGWTFVPASVDGWGRREPAYLYTSGDVASCTKRIQALREACDAVVDREAALAVRAQRVQFAHAQLQAESFRLHALHGTELTRFEADVAALETLKDDELTAKLESRSARWSVVGPTRAWRAHFADAGSIETPRAPMQDLRDPEAERELARMWTALGGSERWRDLATLRILGSIDPGGEDPRQGTEQWIDFVEDRFALSQVFRAEENLIAATPTEAWIVDRAAGVDMTPAQASKFRGRQERTLFSVLRSLAQPDRGGIVVLRVGERLVLLESARTLGWLELDAAGLPARLGYTLEGSREESLYEFHDWKLDAKLPYPARTLQIDRAASVELTFVGPNVKLDPLLWTRAKR